MTPRASRQRVPANGGRNAVGLPVLRASNGHFGLALNPTVSAPMLKSMGSRAWERWNVFHKIMPRVEVKVWNPCNANCMYCYNPPESMVHESDRIGREKIAAAASTGVSSLILGGSELTLRSNGHLLALEGRNQGFDHVELMTNGILFYQENVLKSFLDNGLTEVFLHFSAAESKMYESLLGRSGTFEPAVAALDHILAETRRLRLTVFTVINCRNIRHLSDVVEFVRVRAERAGSDSYSHCLGFYCVFSPSSNAWRNARRLMPRMRDAAEQVQRCLEREREPCRLFYAGLPLCLMSGFEALSWDLYVRQACFPAIAAGAKPQPDFSFVQPLYRRTEFCGACAHAQPCPGIYASYTAIHGMGEFGGMTIGSSMGHPA